MRIYDEKMNYLRDEDKKVAHREGLWHKVVSAILYNKNLKTIYFQTIYPKESYTFERPDYMDISIGGHVEGDEPVEQALFREAKEELNFVAKKYDFLGIRVCNCDPSETYKIREFQFFYAAEVEKPLKEMDFSESDREVKSVIEIKIDDFLALLIREKTEVFANEMILDKISRKGEYKENIIISKGRIVPDYYNDKSILEKFLSVKALMA